MKVHSNFLGDISFESFEGSFTQIFWLKKINFLKGIIDCNPGKIFLGLNENSLIPKEIFFKIFAYLDRQHSNQNCFQVQFLLNQVIFIRF